MVIRPRRPRACGAGRKGGEERRVLHLHIPATKVGSFRGPEEADGRAGDNVQRVWTPTRGTGPSPDGRGWPCARPAPSGMPPSCASCVAPWRLELPWRPKNRVLSSGPRRRNLPTRTSSPPSWTMAVASPLVSLSPALPLLSCQNAFPELWV